MKISEIYCYPIKSLAGISLSTATLTDRGLLHDRRWMLVRPDGTFFTQRQFPQMALLQPSFSDSHLIVAHKKQDIPPIHIPFHPETEDELQVTVWGDTCKAVRVSDAADAWFANVLGIPCHLVYMQDNNHRQIDLKYTTPGKWVSFADGYPYLILGQASMDLLNEKLDSPISVIRFRPNFVFTGGQPHEEDTWTSIEIGGTHFRGVKPCARCQIPTIDPETAEMGKEPTRTLATYRAANKKILFGMNLMGPAEGLVSVGDVVIGSDE